MNSEDEILIEFAEAYKALVIRAFKRYDGETGKDKKYYEDYEIQDERFKKRLVKGWAKRKSNDSMQTVVSKEDNDYLQ